MIFFVKCEKLTSAARGEVIFKIQKADNIIAFAIVRNGGDINHFRKRSVGEQLIHQLLLRGVAKICLNLYGIAVNEHVIHIIKLFRAIGKIYNHGGRTDD